MESLQLIAQKVVLTIPAWGWVMIAIFTISIFVEMGLSFLRSLGLKG